MCAGVLSGSAGIKLLYSKSHSQRWHQDRRRLIESSPMLFFGRQILPNLQSRRQFISLGTQSALLLRPTKRNGNISTGSTTELWLRSHIFMINIFLINKHWDFQTRTSQGERLGTYALAWWRTNSGMTWKNLNYVVTWKLKYRRESRPLLNLIMTVDNQTKHHLINETSEQPVKNISWEDESVLI